LAAIFLFDNFRKKFGEISVPAGVITTLIVFLLGYRITH
jgi:hypothetical protein